MYCKSCKNIDVISRYTKYHHTEYYLNFLIKNKDKTNVVHKNVSQGLY